MTNYVRENFGMKHATMCQSSFNHALQIPSTVAV